VPSGDQGSSCQWIGGRSRINSSGSCPIRRADLHVAEAEARLLVTRNEGELRQSRESCSTRGRDRRMSRSHASFADRRTASASVRRTPSRGAYRTVKACQPVYPSTWSDEHALLVARETGA
jgi:hypothetical protein